MRPVLFLCVLVLLLPAIAGAAPPRLVKVGLFLTDIAGLDERAETYTAEFDVIARWQDPARAFTPVAGEEIPRLHVNEAARAYLDEGWSPAVIATNMVAAVNDRMVRVLVLPDGTVNLRLNVARVLRAPLDFRHFPFDEQVLPVHIESVLHDSDELTLEAESEFTGFDPDFEMAEWRVVGLDTERRVRQRLQEQQDYDRLSFLVRLDRHTGYYVWKIMLPMLVIVALSWIVFWLSDERLGRRAGISSTGILTLIAYQFVVFGALPRFPYLTIMDYFIMISLLTVAATMIVNLVGSRLDDQGRLRLDRVCRGVFPSAYALIVFGILMRSGG